MLRLSFNEVQIQDGRLMHGYDYKNQAWVLGGKYIACGHPRIDCGCWSRMHAGEDTAPDSGKNTAL